MGLSVWNQVDNDKYFSISSIDKKLMIKNDINMPIEKFKEIVRRTNPYALIPTGSNRVMGQRRMTKIYRYADFTACGGGNG